MKLEICVFLLAVGAYDVSGNAVKRGRGGEEDAVASLENISEKWDPVLIGTGCFVPRDGEQICTHSLGFFPELPNDGQKEATFR